MIPNELRLTNLCIDKKSNTILKIMEITSTCLTTYVIDRDKYPLSEGWKAEPIKITEEWLLKLGFIFEGVIYKKNWFDLWYSSYSESYQLRIYKVGSDIENIINIKYVHQLQNLYFALTGEELELNK